MKRSILFAAVLSLLGASGSWANDSVAQPDFESFRIRCESQGTSSNYVQLRGTAVVSGDRENQPDNSRASFRFAFSAIRTVRADMIGDYVENGGIQFLLLRPLADSDVEEVYINFRDSGLSEGSYVVTRSRGIHRMACRIER